MPSLPSKADLPPTCVLVHNQISQCCTVPFPHSYTSPSNPGFWLGHLRLRCRGSKQQLLWKPLPTPSQGTWPKPAYLNDASCMLKGMFALIYFLVLPRLFLLSCFFFSLRSISNKPKSAIMLIQRTQTSRSSGTTDGLDHLLMSLIFPSTEKQNKTKQRCW